MDDDEALKESVSNLRSAILLRRTDIVRGILSTAAEYRGEDEMFGDDEEDGDSASKVPYDYYDDPFDILRMMLNYVDNDAGTCLHLATKLEYADAVRALLAAGADPTIINKEGATSFDYCTDKTMQDIYNEELLQAAASSNVERMRRLLAAGVSVDASDGASSDNKVLHWAASFGNAETVRLLCENDVDVNATNSQGATALHDAVKRGDLNIVNVLLQYGASRNIVPHTGSMKGCRPVDLAVLQEMKHLLENFEIQNPVSNGQMMQGKVADTDSESSSSESPSSSSQGTRSLRQYPGFQSHLKRIPVAVQSGNSPIQMDSHLLRLWPPPQKLTQLKGPRFFPTTSLHVFVCRGPGTGDSLAVCEIWNTLEPHFQQVGYHIDIQVSSLDTVSKSGCAGSVQCYISSSLFTQPESYKIHISALKVSIVASEFSSMWHAGNTLLQILRLYHGKGVPQIQICDWPDLRYRGLLLDVSTGRVPKLETLFSLIDILSSMKMNHLQLYMQNSFAFRGHDAVWRNSSAYTPSDLVKLDNYCRARYIELVPHFESLTGFSGWFKYRHYKDLADLPVELDKVDNKIPSCLCPTSDESTRLVGGLFSQLFPCFSSTRFAHVGLDINEEFGRGKSKPVADNHGCDEMYMSYLRSVYKLCCQSGRNLQFWANPLHNYPEQLWNLPPDVVAVEYGDQVDHEFEKYCSRLSEAGVSFLVSPGTLNWNSVCGNSRHSLKLINDAVQAAVTFGALGVLITEWSLPSHLNPLIFSVPVILTGACLAWKPDVDVDFVQSILPDILSIHTFLDKSKKIGKLLQTLGDANSVLAKVELQESTDKVGVSVHPQEHAPTGTTLWEILDGAGSINLDSFSLDTVQKTNLHLRKCQKIFPELDLQCLQNSAIVKELDITVDLLLFACRVCRALLLARKENGKATNVKDLPAINRTDLANRMLGLVEHFQKVYLLRNRQGGLLSSVQSLQTILQDLLPEGRIDSPVS